jgi:hypothetical protein
MTGRLFLSAMSELNLPHFFILGAPKCGTTSLAAYLADHPKVYFSQPKEPNYFNMDFSESHRKFHSLDSYANACFPAASKDLLRGEATVWHLVSDVAIEEILKAVPQARCIVMLRDPKELIPSLHATLLRALTEDVHDVHQAFLLQDQRRQGKHIPGTSRNLHQLLYTEVASLGKQMQRLQSLVPENRIHCIWFDDFKASPKAAYESTCGFLGIQPEAIETFSNHNPRKVIHAKWLAWVIGRLSQSKWIRKTKQSLGFTMGKGPLSTLSQLNSKEVASEGISLDFQADIKEALSEDVALLASLTGRNLDHWL